MTATFDLEKAWEPYAELLPTPVLADKISLAQQFIQEPLMALIPSIHLMPDGPTVVTVFLLTQRLLGEVLIPEAKFDFTDRRRMINMRWAFGKAEGQKADGTAIHYQTADLQIVHGSTKDDRSGMHYVGTERDRWVDLVRTHFPALTLVL